MRYVIFALLVAGIGFGCIRLADHGARALERLLIGRVENGLAVLEIGWAEVRADGLRIEVHGRSACRRRRTASRFGSKFCAMNIV
jgi:hypothetical protein